MPAIDQRGLPPLPMFQPAAADDDAPCCGSRPGPPSSPDERPGYQLCPFVRRFIPTPAGPVPEVATRLGLGDWLGWLRARLGIGRDRYRIAPGLYAVGSPGAESPVLVAANYKLSFDLLRRELGGLDAWLVVLDTRGINVWCAAGKKTFATAEVVRRLGLVRLAEVVSHRELILPQLGAPGVAAQALKAACGFSAVWGPVRARDLKGFLAAGRQATPEMRQVSFTLAERAVLIPVELSLILKPSLWVLVAVAVLSALGPHFSWPLFVRRALDLALAYGAGMVSGAVAVPLLLPWLPGRSFYLKGLLTGAVAGLGVALLRRAGVGDGLAMTLLALAVGSYGAMNFTGATPFTSPTGVEKEMRRGIPAQVLALLLAVGLWVGQAFWRIK